jgi:hypothetical protein
MIVLKVISTAIMVSDCINVYTDPDNIRRYIENNFLERCFSGCYILAIKNILRVGRCEISQDGAPNIGKIPVTFEAETIVYVPGEIINGCEVRRTSDEAGGGGTSDNILYCDTKYACIWIKPHPLAKSITVGQKISIRVGKAGYKMHAAKIAISAVIYLPGAISAPVYQVGRLTESKVNEHLLAGVLSRVKQEETDLEKLKKDNPQAVNFFTLMLQPYVKPPPAPPAARVISIKDISTGLGGISYLCRDPRLSLTEPKVYGYEKYSDGPVSNEINDINDIILALYEDYCAGLRTIREMISIYSTNDLILSHENIWLMYKKSKSQ